MSANTTTILLIIVLLLGIGIVVVVLNEIVNSLAARLNKRLLKGYEKPHLPKDKKKTPRKIDWLPVLSIALSVCLALQAIVYGLSQTLANSSFTVAELNKLDIPSAASELLIDPSSPYQQYTRPALDSTLQDLNGWVRLQMNGAMLAMYDYFKGNAPEVNVSIPLDNFQAALKQNLTQLVAGSPPPGIDGANQQQVQAYVDNIYSSVFKSVPPRFTTSSSGTRALRTVHAAFTAYRVMSYVLIPLIFLLMFGIILREKDIRATTRKLGSGFFVAGALGYLYGFIFRGIVSGATRAIPFNSLQQWILQLAADALAALRSPSLVLFSAGVILLAISLFYHGKLARARPVAAK